MPDEQLLTELSRIQDAYGQRERAIKSLISALRNTNNTLAKAGRSLRDYVALPVVAAEERAEAAQQTLAGLSLKDEVIDPLSAELRREAKTVGTINAALKDAGTALRGESVDVVRLDHALAALRSRTDAQPPETGLPALLPVLAVELELAQRALGHTFGAALRHAAAAQGLEVGGTPPRFAIGRFEISVDFAGRHATISYGKELVTRRIPLSVEAVLRAYTRDHKTVAGRNEDGARWIENFHQAWTMVRRRREISGSRASLVECYVELALLRQGRSFRSAPLRSNLVEYTRPQFAYDFFEFVQRQRLDYKGWRAHTHVATKSHADSAERSIWIVEGTAPHEGQYISDVSFTREG